MNPYSQKPEGCNCDRKQGNRDTKKFKRRTLFQGFVLELAIYL